MADYEHSATVTADPDELFRYLSDVHNLPDYFATMREAERTGEHVAGGDEVHVVAEVDGKERAGEAWMDTDTGNRTLSWGSEGPNSYRGDLHVDGGSGTAEVTVRLHTERADGPGIRAGLEQTLASIKQQVEGSSVDNG